MPIERTEHNSLKLAGASFAGIVVASLLIAGLLNYAGIDLRGVLRDIQIIPAWALVLIVLSMLFNILIGAQNWRLVVEHVSRPDNSGPGYFFYAVYTSVSAFLGLFIPLQVSTTIVRSAALHIGGFSSIKKSTATALVSQIQDITIILLFAFPGILVIFWKINSLSWLICEAILLVIGLIFFKTLFNPLAQKISSLNIGLRGRQIGVLRDGLTTGLFDGTLMVRLYHYSLLKFVILALQSYLIAWIIGLRLSPEVMFSISAMARLSALIAFTPGNVGVAEWSWVGLLSLTGIATYDAGYFAVTSTVLGYLSTIIVFAGMLILFFLGKICRFSVLDSHRPV